MQDTLLDEKGQQTAKFKQRLLSPSWVLTRTFRKNSREYVTRGNPAELWKSEAVAPSLLSTGRSLFLDSDTKGLASSFNFTFVETGGSRKSCSKTMRFLPRPCAALFA